MKPTPEGVVAAFMRTGMKPIKFTLGLTPLFGFALNPKEHLGCGCALGVLYVDRDIADCHNCVEIARVFGLDAVSFTNGFDGREHVGRSDDDYLLGKACYQACIDAGLV